MKFGNFIKKFSLDLWLIIPVLVLLVLGLATLYSLALSLGDISFSNFYKQLLFVPAGLVIFLFVSLIDYRLFYQYAKFGYILSIFLLIAVLIFGENFRGTTGWFVFGDFVWQPVEVIKILWVIWISYFFVNSNFKENQIISLIISLLSLFILVALIMFQPDLGSAALLIITWFGMVFLLSFNKKYILWILVFKASFYL